MIDYLERRIRRLFALRNEFDRCSKIHHRFEIRRAIKGLRSERDGSADKFRNDCRDRAIALARRGF